MSMNSGADEGKTAKLAKSFYEINEEATLDTIKEALEKGVDPLAILDELHEGVEVVGNKFEVKEYCLADMYLASEIFKSAMEILEPFLAKPFEELGKFVIGTARGDIHDIGKKIVITLMRNTGFKTIDLGVDVPPKSFVKAVKKHKPDIVGISGLLSTSADFMKETIKALEKAGMRRQVKIMLGGRVIKERFAELKEAGADHLSSDAKEAVKLAVGMMKSPIDH